MKPQTSRRARAAVLLTALTLPLTAGALDMTAAQADPIADKVAATTETPAAVPVGITTGSADTVDDMRQILTGSASSLDGLSGLLTGVGSASSDSASGGSSGSDSSGH